MKFEIHDSPKPEEPNVEKRVFRLDTSDMDLNLQVKDADGKWKTLLWIDHYDLILRVCGNCDFPGKETLIEMAENSRRQRQKDRLANMGDVYKPPICYGVCRCYNGSPWAVGYPCRCQSQLMGEGDK